MSIFRRPRGRTGQKGGRGAFLLHVLHLLADFFESAFQVNGFLGEDQVHGLRRDGVRLAVHFLNEKVELPPDWLLAYDEILELGFEDAMGDGISLIEWPDQLGHWLPVPRIEIHLVETRSDTSRQLRLRAVGAGSERWRAPW